MMRAFAAIIGAARRRCRIFMNFIILIMIIITHVMWAPCHHDMARPQVADGGDGLQIWRVAANILNKQSRTVDKGVGRGANNSSR
jgi:hypothetical protein